MKNSFYKVEYRYLKFNENTAVYYSYNSKMRIFHFLSEAQYLKSYNLIFFSL